MAPKLWSRHCDGHFVLGGRWDGGPGRRGWLWGQQLVWDPFKDVVGRVIEAVLGWGGRHPFRLWSPLWLQPGFGSRITKSGPRRPKGRRWAQWKENRTSGVRGRGPLVPDLHVTLSPSLPALTWGGRRVQWLSPEPPSLAL